MFKCPMAEEFGITLQTTFWDDFSIADRFGISGIADTYKRAFSEWKNNYIYITELALVLNWKIWEYWDKEKFDYAEYYDKLWKETDNYAMDNLKGEELRYYMRKTD